MLTKKCHYNLCIVWRLVICWGCRLRLQEGQGCSVILCDTWQPSVSAECSSKWWQPCQKDYGFVLETGCVNLSYSGCIICTHPLPPLPCALGFPLLPRKFIPKLTLISDSMRSRSLISEWQQTRTQKNHSYYKSTVQARPCKSVSSNQTAQLLMNNSMILSLPCALRDHLAHLQYLLSLLFLLYGQEKHTHTQKKSNTVISGKSLMQDLSLHIKPNKNVAKLSVMYT